MKIWLGFWVLFLVDHGSTQPATPPASTTTTITTTPITTTTTPKPTDSRTAVVTTDSTVTGSVETTKKVLTSLIDNVDWYSSNFNPFASACGGPYLKYSTTPGQSRCVYCDSLDEGCNSTDNTVLAKYVKYAYTDCIGYCTTVYREDRGEMLSPFKFGKRGLLIGMF